MRLAVLVPAYNEAASLETLLRRVAAVALPLEIIVVDDASTDGSGELLDRLAIDGLRVIHHPANRGKGAAVRTAIAAATADAVVIQDADLEYSPEDFPTLLAPIAAGTAVVVYGVRDLTGQPWARRWGNHLLTRLTNRLYGASLHDMETCYKMMRTEVARSLDLEAERFDIEPEITVKLLARGYAIHEVPIRYAPRRERKLNPWQDGPHALWTLLKWRWRTGPPPRSARRR
jgi:glycosyltransferase involved in cell wall biosynthesis